MAWLLCQWDCWIVTPVTEWNSDPLWTLPCITTGFCTCSGSGQTPDLQQYSEWTIIFMSYELLLNLFWMQKAEREEWMDLWQYSEWYWLIDWQELWYHDTFCSVKPPLILWAVWRMLRVFWLVPELGFSKSLSNLKQPYWPCLKGAEMTFLLFSALENISSHACIFTCAWKKDGRCGRKESGGNVVLDQRTSQVSWVCLLGLQSTVLWLCLSI